MKTSFVYAEPGPLGLFFPFVRVMSCPRVASLRVLFVNLLFTLRSEKIFPKGCCLHEAVIRLR